MRAYLLFLLRGTVCHSIVLPSFIEICKLLITVLVTTPQKLALNKKKIENLTDYRYLLTIGCSAKIVYQPYCVLAAYGVSNNIFGRSYDIHCSRPADMVASIAHVRYTRITI